jgi:hypothetical protein
VECEIDRCHGPGQQAVLLPLRLVKHVEMIVTQEVAACEGTSRPVEGFGKCCCLFRQMQRQGLTAGTGVLVIMYEASLPQSCTDWANLWSRFALPAGSSDVMYGIVVVDCSDNRDPAASELSCENQAAPAASICSTHRLVSETRPPKQFAPKRPQHSRCMREKDLGSQRGCKLVSC